MDKFPWLGGLPFFLGFPNCLYHKGTRGGGVAPPRGPGPVTWGASPSFTEDQHARVWPWVPWCAPGPFLGRGRRDTPREAATGSQATHYIKTSAEVSWPGSLPLFNSPRAALGATGRRRGHGGLQVAALGPHPMMHLCRNTRCVWVGGGGHRKPSGGLGHRETRRSLANLHPPVDPALYHPGSPRWPGMGRVISRTNSPRLDWFAPQIAC